MKIKTKASGIIEVDEKKKITFREGLFGFESLQDYALFNADEPPFYWLQSLDNAQIAFIVINPFLFRSDYEVCITDEIVADLGLSSPDQVLVLTIVTIPADEKTITINLQGPLIINSSTRLGKQMVLQDPRWKTKHDIIAELAAKSC
ncbi:MAG: flagellar assembly protein FliW [Spirochaetaceae bacterium]|jgi:flagellar assembly factor FliW|nr:flagellar assembly protein FliW [Spirochaetaceae bacterium]